MKNVLLAVLLSVFIWPGAGQLYNRELRKGFILIGLSVLVVMSFMIGAVTKLGPILGQLSGGALDFVQARKLTEEMVRANPELVKTFNILMSLIWLYSAIDAAFGAKDRIKPEEGNSQEEQE